MSPLAQSEEQREQDRADEQPLADRHAHRHGSAQSSKHESAGNRQHVQNDQVFEDAAVCDNQTDVDQRDDRELEAQVQRETKRAHQ